MTKKNSPIDGLQTNFTTTLLTVGFVLLLIIAGYSQYQLYQLNQNLVANQISTNSKLGDLDTKLGSLDTNVAKVNSEISNLENADNIIAKALDDQGKFLDTKITKLETESDSQFQNVQSKITSVEAQSKAIKKDLQSQIKDINVQSSDFTSIIDEVLKSVVSVLTDKGVGSGFFAKQGNYVITNYHVIEGAGTIQILSYDNKLYQATIVATDQTEDMALLSITSSYPTLSIANIDDVQIGAKVIALGNPSGLGFSVTEGIVSQVRDVGGLSFVQTDVPINPGNSGGPLVNIKKQVYGINTWKFAGTEGLGFAIAPQRVQAFLDEN